MHVFLYLTVPIFVLFLEANASSGFVTLSVPGITGKSDVDEAKQKVRGLLKKTEEAFASSSPEMQAQFDAVPMVSPNLIYNNLASVVFSSPITHAKLGRKAVMDNGVRSG